MSNYKKQMIDGTAKRCSALARSNELFDRIRTKFPDYDPIELLCEFSRHPLTEDSLRIKAAEAVAKFMYPTIKSSEISGIGEDGEVELTLRTIKFVTSEKKDSDEN